MGTSGVRASSAPPRSVHASPRLASSPRPPPPRPPDRGAPGLPESLTGSVAGAHDPDIPTSATFTTSDEPTDTQAIAGEAAPEQDPKVLEAERQALRRAADYSRRDDLEDRIDSSSVDAPAAVPARPVAPPPRMPPTNKNEMIKTDSDDIASTEHDLAGGEGKILDGVELPKTESVDRRLISYYSPRLKRYIMEEL